MIQSDYLQHTVGKRKTSIARLYVKEGSGKITVNKKSLDAYSVRPTSKKLVMQPLELTETTKKYDFNVNVIGGGLSSQAGAIRHAISKALCLLDEAHRPTLKKEGLLTRDSRKKERKLPGQPGARKKFQFSKR